MYEIEETDKEFLEFLHQRLLTIYGEYDYSYIVQKLAGIIEGYDPSKTSECIEKSDGDL